MFRYYYRNRDDDIIEFSDRIQKGWAKNPGTAGLVMNAEEGSIGISSLRVEDPAGDWDIDGLRVVYVVEEDCIDDIYSGRVYTGYSASRKIERDNQRTGAARIWTIDLVDINTVFDRRIMEGADSNRPAETDVARIAWALSTNEASLIGDDTYFSTDGPFSMDAVDYRGQSFKNIFDDCAQQSGKNWYLWRPTAGYSAWYQPRGTTDFSSDIKISNDLADIDGTTVFEPSLSSVLTRDPSRVYSGVHMAYANAFVYVQRESTAAQFARRDAFSPAPNVKTATKAKIRANRYLSDIATEEDVISTAIIVPRAQVNDVTQGQRIQSKFTHLPGYEDYVWMRVLNRTVRELNPDLVELAMELTPDEPVNVPVTTVHGILRRSTGGDAYPIVHYDWVGDDPGVGGGVEPTVGLIEPVTDPDAASADYPFIGWKMLGDGEVDVTFYITTIGITPTSVTFDILKNGTSVATLTQYNSDTGNANDGKIVVTGLSVATNDILTTRFVADPQGVPFFRTPRGTGQGGERFEITGGSLI